MLVAVASLLYQESGLRFPPETCFDSSNGTIYKTLVTSKRLVGPPRKTLTE